MSAALLFLPPQILEHVAAQLGLDSAAVKAANFLLMPDHSSSSNTSNTGTSHETASAKTRATADADDDDDDASGLQEGETVHSPTTPDNAAGSSSGSGGGGSSSSSGMESYNEGRSCVGSPAALKLIKQQQQQDEAAAGRAPAGCYDYAIGKQKAASTAAAAAAGKDSITPAAAAAATSKAGVTTLFGRHIPTAAYTLLRVWQQLLQSSSYSQRVAAVQQHNRQHAWSKRGIVVTPIRCVIKFVACVQP
jgi:hypothetical protein